MKNKTAEKLVKRIVKYQQEESPNHNGEYKIDTHPLKLKEFQSTNFKTHVIDVLNKKFGILILNHTINKHGKLIAITFVVTNQGTSYEN